MKYIIVIEPNGRLLYINLAHIISFFADTESLGSNIKVSDGKVYKVTQNVMSVLALVDYASSGT